MRTAWDPGMNLTAKAEQAARKNLSSSKKALQEASEQFESLFLNILLSEMRKTVLITNCSVGPCGEDLPIYARPRNRR